MTSVQISNFKRNCLQAALALAVAFGGMGMAANAHAITATADANVVTAITVNQDRALGFGKFVKGSDQTIIVANTDSLSISGTATKVSQGTLAKSGKFTVTGDAGTAYTFSIAQSEITLTHTDTGITSNNTMVVSAFTPSVTTAGLLSGTEGTSGATGTQVVYVGGTVTQGDNNAPGLYTGSYTVTVAYN